jgi:AmiR/NasT family two-component response regulator
MKKANDTKVLVAEDDTVVFKITEKLLKNKGFILAGRALNGTDVVEMVPLLKPDVVLMDIEMPEMDGITAAKMLMAKHPVPIVILTSHETSHFLQSATEAGVGAYLIKPPNARDLELTILVAMARFDDLMRVKKLNEELKAALSRVKTLSGLIPICARCKKIRSDTGFWEEVETYIHQHSDAHFSHGICPECSSELYEDFLDDD